MILNRRNFLRGVFFMPIFEYICNGCQHEFEALIFGKQKAECPKCQSKNLEPQLSVFAVSAKGTAQPSFSTGSPGPCGSCGDARGPGACALKNFD
jgi:putative FmdB family regulatory protein